MYVVALLDPPLFTPTHARRLAAVLGCSPLDAAERLRVPGRGPAVLRCVPDVAAAAPLVAAFDAAGFTAIVQGPEPSGAVPLEVHAVGVDESRLLFDTPAGRRLIALDTVRALVWGVRVLRHEATNRDVVWRGAQGSARAGFVWVFMADGVVAHIEEARIQGLAEGGFAAMAEALRRACGRAIFDDRLLATRTQRQILGPDLDPAEHLGLAIRLVVRHRTA